MKSLRRASLVAVLVLASCTGGFPAMGGSDYAAEILATAGVLSSISSSSSTNWLAYNPASVSGLKLWLKADSIAQANATAVASWTDSSGTGNSIIAGTSPTYYSSTNLINGRPMVRFTGAQQLVKAAPTGLSTSDSASIFIVMRPAAAAVYEILAVGNCGSLARQLTYNNGTLFEINKMCVGQVASPAMSWPTGTTKQITILQNLAVNITTRLDGVQIGSSVPAFTTYGGGALTLGGVTPSLNADVAEILFYDNRISDANASDIECYLGARYGTRSCP